jgi:hypothetical protein
MTDPWYYEDVGTPPAFPWPPADGGGFLAAMGSTWKAATFEPVRFFTALPREGGIGAAVLYYLIIGVLVAGASLFWDALGQSSGMGQDVLLADGPVIQPLIAFLLSPMVLVFALVLSAGVTHLMLLLVRGATHGFDTTLRVFCYAYSPMLFGVIPLLGTLVGMAWMLVAAVLGLAAAHGTERWKPALAVVLPFIILVGLAVMALLTVVAAGSVLV